MRAILVATLAVLMATPAWADYVGNRTQWNALDAQRKADYAMGLFDGLSQVSIDDRIGLEAVTARNQCVFALAIGSSDLALLIDEGYAADAGTWSQSPLAILLRQTNRVCRSQINAAVIAAGGEPFIP